MPELDTLGPQIADIVDAVADKNLLTDAERTKLSGISAGATVYTDEMAQDAIGNILTDGTTINFSYNDAGNVITGEVQSIANTHIAPGANIDAAKLGTGIISTSELNSLDGVSSPVQTQLDAKAPLAPRVGTTASSATPTPDAAAHDLFTVSALAVAATIGAPTGTPLNGQALLIRIRDNGTARTLAYNAIYRPIGITLPATTVASKTLYLGMIYNSADSKWDVTGVAQEA